MDAPVVVIRAIEPSDSTAELTELLHRAYAKLAAQGFRYLATHQGEDVTRRRISQGECYVGAVERRLVATVVFKPAAATDGCGWYDREDVCSFGQFAVDPPFQSHGIGSRLMDVVEQRARETGAAEIALDTAEGAADLIAVYERRGYRFIEYARWPDVNYRSVIMSRRIGSRDATRR